MQKSYCVEILLDLHELKMRKIRNLRGIIKLTKNLFSTNMVTAHNLKHQCVFLKENEKEAGEEQRWLYFIEMKYAEIYLKNLFLHLMFFRCLS